jgi:hypothetical protein
MSKRNVDNRLLTWTTTLFLIITGCLVFVGVGSLIIYGVMSLMGAV